MGTVLLYYYLNLEYFYYRQTKEYMDESRKNNNGYLILFCLLFALIVAIFTQKVLNTVHIKSVSPNPVALYYFFSSSAKAIAALIGTILTGYIFLDNIMQFQERNKEDLIGVYKYSREMHFFMFKKIAVLTGFTLIIDLSIVLWDIWSSNYVASSIAFIIMVNFSVIIIGIKFVIYIINPQHIRNFARIKKSSMENPEGKKDSKGSLKVDEFYREFNILADIIEKLYKNVIGKEIDINRHFRKMIVELRDKSVITTDMSKRLLDLADYKDILHHSNAGTISDTYISIIKTIISEINCINAN